MGFNSGFKGLTTQANIYIYINFSLSR